MDIDLEQGNLHEEIKSSEESDKNPNIDSEKSRKTSPSPVNEPVNQSLTPVVNPPA